MFMRPLLTSILLLCLFPGLFPQARITEPASVQLHYEEGYILCDSANCLTLDSVKNIHDSRFRPFLPEYGMLSKQFTYWIRFRMPHVPEGRLLAVSAAMKLSAFDVYIPKSDSEYVLYRNGFDYFYCNWPIRNYSTSVPLPVFRNDLDFFIRVKPSMLTGMGIQMADIVDEMNDSVHNFFGYGIFLGICFIVALYMLIFFFFIRENTYLFYSFYVLSFSIFGIVSWGFICWPLSYFHLGWTNDYYTIPFASMTVFLLLYTRSFLSAKEKIPVLARIMLYSALLRIVIYFTGLLSGRYFFYNPNNDSLLLLSAWVAGIVSWARGYKPARYLTLGFSVLYAGFLEHSLHYMNFITTDTRFFSIFNTGAAEIVLFSLALADRFRILKTEKEQAVDNSLRLQGEVIRQLKENEILKDKVTRELEGCVKERTRDLEKANEVIVSMNSLLKEHNIQLESDIKSIAEKRVLDEPVTFEEFQKIYTDEYKCYELIEELKWSNGFVCSKCSNTKYSVGTTKHSRRCSKCNYIERITSHTIFSRVKIPINKAFYMLFLVSSGKKLTLNELSEMLSIRRQTCWAFKKKIDEAFVKMPKNKGSKENWKSLILYNHADTNSL
jgi:two-component system, sensor histidine kinase LadS